MEILRARPTDAVTLTEIAFAAKRHWRYPERWIASWSHLLTIAPGSIAEQETHTATVNGEPVGFYSLSHGAGRMSLQHLWVLPEAMHKGIGRALFHHAIERMTALGYHTLDIESDPNATGFYERMGACRVGSTMTEIEGLPRELPVFVYLTAPSSDTSPTLASQSPGTPAP